MTFTYDLDSFGDLERVRFHINDTVEADARFSDEEITAIITEEGDWQQAVISLLENLIAKLSQPNFKADWLTVDNDVARKGYETLLAIKQAKFGVVTGRIITGSSRRVYRKDSNLTSKDVNP